MTSSDRPIEFELKRLLLQLAALGDEIVRVAELGITAGKYQDPDGHVDQEDPSPTVLVGDPSPERRADNRRDEGRQAKERHRNALLFPGEGVQQHALAAGLQTAARQALDNAKQDKLTEAAGHPAQCGTEGEYGYRQQEVVSPTQMRAQPAGDRQDNGVGGKVAGENPFTIIDRRRQAAGDIPKCDNRDRGIEHLHERRHHDRGGQEPRAPRSTGCDGCERRIRHLLASGGLWDEPVDCNRGW